MKTSKLLSLLVAGLLLGSLLVGPAAAVETEAGDVPEEAEVGTDVEVTFEMTQLFDEFEEWTLQGSTDLTNVTWTVRQFDQADNQISQTSYDGQSFSEGVTIDDGTSRIEIRITGTTPPVENFTYQPPQNFTLASFVQARSGGTENQLGTYRVHHYTQESKEARNAIDSARTAVESSGSDSGQALLDSAISSYNNGNFENAKQSARRAEDEGSQRALIRNVALGIGGLVVLGVVLFGGYRLYKSRQQGPSRLK